MELNKIIHKDTRTVKMGGGGEVIFRPADEYRNGDTKSAGAARDRVTITGSKSAIEMPWTAPAKSDESQIESISSNVIRWLGVISRSDAFEKSTMEVRVDQKITLVFEHLDTEHLNVRVYFLCLSVDDDEEVKIDFGNPTAEIASNFFDRFITAAQRLAR
jgi:hypothetical protein